MAPFYSLVGNIIDHTAIIHDLNVVTTITTDGHYAGGMVGYVYHSASISNGGQAIAVALQGRTLYTDGRWNTLCLPFDLGDATADESHHFDGTPLEGFTVKELDTGNDYGEHVTGLEGLEGLCS